MATPAAQKYILVLAAFTVCAFAVNAAGAPSGKGIRCSLAKVTDTQRSGLVAYTYFVPNGWESHSNLTWNGASFVSDFSASTPDTQYSVEHLEPLDLTYVASNGKVTQGFRITKGIDFVQAVVNRLAQSGKVSNVRVIEQYNESVPLTQVEKNLPKPLPSIGGMRQAAFNEAAFMKFSFERNGQPMIGSIGSTVYGNFLTNNMQLGYGRTSTQYSSETGTYVIGPTLLVETPVNPSPTKLHETEIVASSGQMTPKFLLYTAALALGMSSDSLKATEERGKQLIKQMREQTEQIKDNFMNAMAQKDAETHKFCNLILDQQDYVDHSGQVVTIPMNYDHSWTDGNGNYILNSDPTFDPKLGWQQLQKAN